MDYSSHRFSNTSLMSIRDMIETAFNSEEVNLVNFKLIQTILFILAQQLRILGRQVSVDLSPTMRLVKPKRTLSVTEVKITSGKGTKKSEKSLAGGKVTKKGAHKSLQNIQSGGGKVAESDEKSSRKGKQLGGRASLQDTVGGDSTSPPGTSSPVKKTKRKGTLELVSSLEELREKELRIIHQRANSKEDPELYPKPIASMTSMAKQEEKLLLVQRVRHDDSGKKDKDRNRPPLSIVTLEEFAELEDKVRQLQNLFGVGSSNASDTQKLLEQISNGASLSEAIAALQVSARLETAEKTLKNMIEMMTDLAQRTGTGEIQGKYTDEEYGTDSDSPRKLSSRKQQKTEGRRETTADDAKVPGRKLTEAEPRPLPPSISSVRWSTTRPSEEDGEQREVITGEELDSAMQELYDNIMAELDLHNRDTVKITDNTLKNIKTLESKLDEAMSLGTKMREVERIVADYAERVTSLDTGLSYQMTNYQEQLTQMQHDLESGLEEMSESLARSEGDPVAVAELNGKFTSLQNDFDNTYIIQKELRDIQNDLKESLEFLTKKIDTLRANVSDREEVSEALKEKAGLSALNGLVSREQFEAVRGDLEKRIGSSYDKFNNQELLWQKSIEDLVKDLNEKVDMVHMRAFRDDVLRNMNLLTERMQFLFDVVGEPRAFATTKKLNKDTYCISCSAGVDMSEEKTLVPQLPAAHAHGHVDSVDNEARGSGDYQPCYPGRRVTHPIDPRAHFCNRFCGGSHTLLTNVKKTLPAINVTALKSTVNTAIGSDGKSYLVDAQHADHPCEPCRRTFTTTPRDPEKETEADTAAHGDVSDLSEGDARVSLELGLALYNMEHRETGISSTPPPQALEDFN